MLLLTPITYFARRYKPLLTSRRRSKRKRVSNLDDSDLLRDLLVADNDAGDVTFDEDVSSDNDDDGRCGECRDPIDSSEKFSSITSVNF